MSRLNIIYAVKMKDLFQQGQKAERFVFQIGYVDVGNRIRVQLIHTDVEKGYIDFKKIH